MVAEDVEEIKFRNVNIQIFERRQQFLIYSNVTIC